MSSTDRRTRISRRTGRTAMLLAGVSVVAAVAATAPTMASAMSESSSGTRQAVTQTRNTESASTAPNLRVEAVNGVTYQYRRFGNPSAGSVPLVFLQHFRGNLDSWDPKLIDTIAAKREVILVDNVGVGGSTGTTASTVQQMALDAIEFVDALKLPRYDVFGFSLGGEVAQEVALRRPWQVRRVVLAGTGPQGGVDQRASDPRILGSALSDNPGPADYLFLFFKNTPSSQAAGKEFLQRLGERTTGHDAPTSLATRDRQMTAWSEWGIPDKSKLVRLKALFQPVLVADGESDMLMPAKNSHLLAKYLPNDQLHIYPDAGHGFLYQYAVQFGTEVNTFLDR
ncbi:alpha/beta fold hydrolase [Streptomyces europaeiscabiei]|uniref:alpha/beta fold hydrolase n=1 Tax=Streptomyces europaeiscabiei TaxID=146819 RepID=UPI001F3C5D06|nr:alpha/beta hydrolase [Streptomyces europaeiscabiei]MDX2528407.1 alpha/beta hydrolase [Streptomyces europaeiscabiei]MDX2768370.1 alpha/beta hydrolase [Streptomyces europaeiscabiei]MDX3777487.1 alpha/beta hydrolase [Streptomyces europaeiscabiei]MDX3862770.1 alpha/beta hydrolase [Streptomyces europaeiscabiei]MDX3870921.1 alpha/beta hydrolase [Streptomyces europaeiscabiei]